MGKGIAIGIGAGLLLLLHSRKGNAMSSTPVRSDVQLSPNFRLSEWLRSTVFPEVSTYEPTEQEIRNARALAVNVLEPLRTQTGPIRISGGARPASMLDRINEALRRAGYRPSRSSDHTTFNGVDIQFPGKSRADYQRAFDSLQANPHVRQVILYMKTQPDGGAVPTHIHVSVIVPGLPTFAPASKFAFYDVDGQRRLASV